MVRKFRDLPVRSKLFGGFGVVLAIVVVLGTVSILQLGNVKSRADHIAKNDLVGNELISDINHQEAGYRIDQYRNLLLSDDAAAHTAEISAAAQADARIEQDLKSFQPLVDGAQDRAYLQRAQSSWEAYKDKTASLLLDSTDLTDSADVTLADDTKTDYGNLDQDLSAWTSLNSGFANHDARRADSTFNSALLIVIVLLILAVIAGLGIAALVSGSIKKAVDQVLNRLRGVQQEHVADIQMGLAAFADGDLTQEFHPVAELISDPSKDELGQVERAVNEIVAALGTAVQAYNDTRAKLNAVMTSVEESATEVSSSSQQLSASAVEAGRAADESGRAAGGIAEAIGQIALGSQRQVEVVEQVRTSAEEVGTAIGEVAKGAERQVQAVTVVRDSADEVGRAIAEIARGAERQVMAVHEAKAAVDRVGGAVATAEDRSNATREVAGKAREISHAGVAAAEGAAEAMDAVRDSSQQVSDVIRELAAKSDEIGNIVGTITSIAEQTNLLALNAAIEAARAGEHGRGFAVVAEEVRKLAEGSRAAAADIAELIKTIQSQTDAAVHVVDAGAERTQEGVGVVNDAKEAFIEIGSAVDNMAEHIELIVTAFREIDEDTQSMHQHINDVAVVAEESSAAAQEVAASAEQVATAADDVAASAEEASASAQEVAASSQQVSASADEVASQVEQTSAATEEVSASAEQVSASAQQTSATAQQVSASADSLAKHAELLAELVAQFKVDVAERATA